MPTGDAVFRHLAPDPDVNERKVVRLVETLDPAVMEEDERQRFVVGVDVAARHRFLADEERLGEPAYVIQIRLRRSQVRADLRGGMSR